MSRWSMVTDVGGVRAGRAATIAVVLACLILTPGCASLGGSPAPATIRLSGADNGSSFEARVGDTIVVALPENPSTGYEWTVDQGVGKVLTLASTKYIPPSGTPPPGAPGTHTFTFRAARTGGTHLVLKYWRPFEGDRSITQRFAITVEVGS